MFLITLAAKRKMYSREDFLKATGAVFFLHLNEPERLEPYLQERSWLEAGEAVRSIEKPGEGNMNHVVRVITDRRSFILKQSRPWVEKFPQIEAPVERTLVEASFYELTGKEPALKGYTPRLIGKDPANYLLLFEDLGQSVDFTYIYQRGSQIGEGQLKKLTRFLSALHKHEFSPEIRRRFPDNMSMRRLNHQHLFVFPLMEDNGFDLDTVLPGLQGVALPYKRNDRLRKMMTALGQRYLETGAHLLHGDYFPGSWMKVDHEVRIIDPEFCFFGPAEYDLGVMTAHLLMARTPAALIEKALEIYAAPPDFDEGLRKAFSGMEIIRRLIGLAQVPVDLTLEERKDLLEKAVSLMAG